MIYPSSLNEITRLAEEVRGAIKKLAVEIEREERYAVDTYSLDGMCAIASYTLQQVLLDHEYESEFVLAILDIDDLNCSHCWVEIDGWIIDITATQFGPEYNEVHIVPIGDNDPINNIYGGRNQKTVKTPMIFAAWGATGPHYHMIWINELVRRLRNH
jgi:hypothetical protein